MEKHKFEEECNKIIDLVVKKYKYSEDLTNVLRKIVPAMISDVTEEEKNLFYQMLMHTPIVVVPKGKGITNQQLEDKYIGNINLHIEEIEVDLGEYGKGEAAGAYVSEPIIDEKMQLIGKKQFIHVLEDDISNLSNFDNNQRYNTFGTGIEVSHLIHELGHAWASENNTYEMDGNILIERVGTCKIKYEIKDLGNGKYSKKEILREGLMIEESLNTNLEEKTISKVLGISLEDVRKLYKLNGMFVQSNYQGLMSDMTQYLLEKTMPEEILKWRIIGDEESLNKINDIMVQTKIYQNRSSDIEHFKAKKEIFSKPEGNKMKEFFEEDYKDFFPDKTNMTPMQYLDNCLLQCYDIKVNQMAFNPFSDNGMKMYRDIIELIFREAYPLINQTHDILKQHTKITMKDLVSVAIKENLTDSEIENIEKEQKIGHNNKENIILE